MSTVWWEERNARLLQAAGMAASQSNCSFDAALLRLKMRAAATHADLEDIAIAVMERRIEFTVAEPGES